MQRVKKVGADFPNQSDALLAEALRASERAEEELARLNRTLRTVNECNKALVRATEEYELLRSVCQILVDVGGLRMVWVGYREFDEGRTVRPVAHAGYEAGYLDLIRITWGDTEAGRGPMGAAIRTGTRSWTRNILTDPNMAPWRPRRSPVVSHLRSHFLCCLTGRLWRPCALRRRAGCLHRDNS